MACAGPFKHDKLELTNALLIDWQVDLKMEKKPSNEDDCPFYQPSSQNVGFRTFLAHMKKTHGWIWENKNFTKWDGCLNGVLKELYSQRYAKYVSRINILLNNFETISCHASYLFSTFSGKQGLRTKKPVLQND